MIFNIKTILTSVLGATLAVILAYLHGKSKGKQEGANNYEQKQLRKSIQQQNKLDGAAKKIEQDVYGGNAATNRKWLRDKASRNDNK